MTQLCRGTYVLRPQETILGEARCVEFEIPRIGQTWFWDGEAICLGTAVLPLGDASVRDRASRALNKRLSRAKGLLEHFEETRKEHQADEGSHIFGAGFVISDGFEQFTLVPLDMPNMSGQVIWCADGVPQSRRTYRVVAVSDKIAPSRSDSRDDLICFTQGTRIATPKGNRLVQNLCAGDKVLTKDNGACEIAWIGHRRLSGALLKAMPRLYPVRIAAGAIDIDIPTDDLLVSPHHRMLITGPKAQALFNQPEVLVTARDLINDKSVYVDRTDLDITYFHILLEQQQIIWANGVQTESYHPAQTSLNMIETSQRANLLDMFPHIRQDPHAYGPFARRTLDRPETAILLEA